MKKVASLFAFLLISLITESKPQDDFFTESDLFLRKYVKNGMVSYSLVKKNFSEIDGLYKQVGVSDLSKFSDSEKKAFYINAYNLIVIYFVAKHYPLKSPMDKSGFFDKVKHVVAGESLTLNQLEMTKLLLPYNDPRIHFVLACAAKSCPPLASYALLPSKLESQLDERTKLSINDPKWLKVDKAKATVSLSKIFEWYQRDFTKNSSLIEWINKYRTEKIPRQYKIEYYEYNWQLNGN